MCSNLVRLCERVSKRTAHLSGLSPGGSVTLKVSVCEREREISYVAACFLLLSSHTSLWLH